MTGDPSDLMPPAREVPQVKREPERVAGPVESVIVLLLSFVLLPLLAVPIQLRLGLGGVALTEALCVLGPVVLALGWSRASPRSALGLSRPPARAWVGAVLVGLGGFYLIAGGVEALQERVAPMSGELREQLRRFIVPASGPRPLLLDLTVLALVPAVCEEALFRGLLLRSLAQVSRGGALLLTSLAFGAFHYSLYKFAPTALLGAMLGALALRANALLPSVLAHALNNVVVILLVRAGLDDPPLPGGAASVALLGGAAATVALGLWLAAKRPAPRTTP